MLDPSLWAGTPYRAPTAFLDLAGNIELFFRGLAVSASNLGFPVFHLAPLGTPGGYEWLQQVQAQLDDAYEALGLGDAPNVADYQLRDEADFTSFTFILSQAVEPLRVTAGML